MVKSSSLSANLESVRRWPVADFCKLCRTGFSKCVDSGRAEWSRAGARIESARDTAMDRGRGFVEGGEVGELGPSKGWYLTFSTLCDLLCDCDRMARLVGVTGRFSGEGGGDGWGAWESGRSALRMLAYVLLGFASCGLP